MSSNDQNRINDDSYVAVFTALAAAAVGSGDILVALFSAATSDRGNIPVTEWLTRVDDPVAGSTFQMNRRGIYVVAVNVPTNVNASIQAGISLDSSIAERQVAFGVASPTFFQFGRAMTAGGQEAEISLTAPIPITQRVADSPSTGFICLQLGDTAGGAPVPTEIITGDVFMSITRVSDLNAA